MDEKVNEAIPDKTATGNGEERRRGEITELGLWFESVREKRQEGVP